jgi:hypothetical protein
MKRAAIKTGNNRGSRAAKEKNLQQNFKKFDKSAMLFLQII